MSDFQKKSRNALRSYSQFVLWVYVILLVCVALNGCSTSRATVREPSWLKVWGDPELDYADGFGRIRSEDIAIDENGCVFVTGYYMGKVDLDPGPGILETEAIEGEPGAAHTRSEAKPNVAYGC